MSTAASTMSTLTEWTQSHFQAIYAATSEDAFNAAIDAFFSPNVEMYNNEKKMTREDAREEIAQRWRGAQRVDVKWENSIEVPKEGEGLTGKEAGLVSGFFVVTRSLRFRVRAAPMQQLNYVTFNGRVEQDPAVEPDEQGDRRRITYLYQTSVDKAAPLHLHPIPNAPIKEDETKA